MPDGEKVSVKKPEARALIEATELPVVSPRRTRKNIIRGTKKASDNEEEKRKQRKRHLKAARLSGPPGRRQGGGHAAAGWSVEVDEDSWRNIGEIQGSPLSVKTSLAEKCLARQPENFAFVVPPGAQPGQAFLYQP